MVSELFMAQKLKPLNLLQAMITFKAQSFNLILVADDQGRALWELHFRDTSRNSF